MTAWPDRSAPALRRRAIGVLLVGLCLLAACRSSTSRAPAAPAPGDEPVVLLVSIDGFRADYLDRPQTPRLQGLAQRGVRAPMRPSYPTLTFPNHYTLVTGRRPDRHGVVGNVMDDPELGAFRMGDGRSAGDGRWFDDAEPLWVTARRAGLVTATMYWPGSEAEIRGLRPDHWRPYREAGSSAERTAGVLSWLDLPAARRPRLITLYFSAVDHAGHHHGPGSAALRAALAEVDAAIGQLVDGIAARGMSERVDLLIVSDHGMAVSDPARSVLLDDLVDLGALAQMRFGQVSGLTPAPGRRAEVEHALLGRHGAIECWRREELPAHWRFGSHRRVAPIVCQADDGARLTTRAWLAGADGIDPGGHGYAPELPSMRAIFIAAGPSFRSGVELPAFDNVEVYPLLAQLLGVPAQAHDADGGLAQMVLRRRQAPRPALHDG